MGDLAAQRACVTVAPDFTSLLVDLKQ